MVWVVVPVGGSGAHITLEGSHAFAVAAGDELVGEVGGPAFEPVQRVRPGVDDVYALCMARTNIELDDTLVSEVMRRYGVSTKKDAVDLALRRLVGAPLNQDFLLGLEGVGWAGGLEAVQDPAPSGGRHRR